MENTSDYSAIEHESLKHESASCFSIRISSKLLVKVSLKTTNSFELEAKVK
jgi:hypothetical protein